MIFGVAVKALKNEDCFSGRVALNLKLVYFNHFGCKTRLSIGEGKRRLEFAEWHVA